LIVEFYFSSTGKIKIVKQRGVFTPSTSLNTYGTQAQASNELATLFASDISPFDSPKPVKMLQDFVSWFSSGNDIVMDFFAGSGTLGDAVLKQNELDGANRRWIMVNLPEDVNESSSAIKMGFKTVSDITRERIKKISNELNIFGSVGFRSFKLGASAYNNFDTEGVEGQLSLMKSSLQGEVSDIQLAFEIFLKSGVSLDSEIKEIPCVGGKILISGGVAAVLSKEVTEELVGNLLEDKLIKTVVFLEDSFIQNDAVKANAYFAFKLSDKNMKTY
jgi:adenine-specific DNA-methyltransferase